MPIGVATPVVDGERLFVSSFYDGSLLLKLRRTRRRGTCGAAGRDEQNTDSLHCMISTPVLAGTSSTAWTATESYDASMRQRGSHLGRSDRDTPDRWSNLHIVRNGDRYWMFNETGELLISKLSAQGFQEISRAKLMEPTPQQLRRRGGVCWSHPAFADRHVFARNDRELVCASLERDRFGY